MHPAHRRRLWKRVEIGFVVFLVVCTSLALLLNGSKAPIPKAFDTTMTLAQATDAARANGRPVLVFATADWCGPCREFKRGALADQRVNAWIRVNTMPVYLNIDTSRREATELGVMAIPSLMFLRDGKIVDRHDGTMETDELIAWLTKRR